MSATRTWLMARLTGALVPQERAELELDAYRDEVRVEDAAEIAALRAQVAELLVERHSTNEPLSEAAEALPVQRDQFAERVHSSHTTWHLEVLDCGIVWVGTGLRTTDREAADELLAQERTARPDVQFRLVRSTTTHAVEGPAAEDTIAPVPAEDVSPQVAKLRGILAGQRSQQEDPHDGPLASRYAVPHDLPTTPTAGSAL
ncbi:hypothetical protein ACIQMY_20960 [Streptomyces sp. NPDC091368]|uniref:hypothetical protein n=1 Tax=Streptomyces sp. NPDC091368 TaxID=3365993 RepID=UPI00381E45E4